MSVHAVLLLLGAIAQLVFAPLQAVLVMFTAASIVDRQNPGPVLSNVLGGSLVVLPAIGLLTAAWLAYLAFRRPSRAAHLWHLVPLTAFAAYFGLAASMMG